MRAAIRDAWLYLARHDGELFEAYLFFFGYLVLFARVWAFLTGGTLGVQTDVKYVPHTFYETIQVGTYQGFGMTAYLTNMNFDWYGRYCIHCANIPTSWLICGDLATLLAVLVSNGLYGFMIVIIMAYTLEPPR